MISKRSEDLLYYLLWACESLLRPISYRPLDGSFEGLCYGDGLGRRLGELERQRLVESEPGSERGRGVPNLKRAFRLTEEGRLRALGGRDPEAGWGRGWDGLWRVVSFDIPQSEATLRNRFRRELCRLGFGHLQDSVWVSPNPIDEVREMLLGAEIDARSLIVLEARPCTGESDQDVVSSAWDFELINERYRRHMEVLADRPKKGRRGKAATATSLRPGRAGSGRRGGARR